MKLKSYKVLGKECKHLDKNLNEADGYFDPEKFTIEIDKSLKGQELQRKIVHELGHALLDRLGVSKDLGDALEHAIVYGFENLICENFDLVRKRKPRKAKKKVK